MGFGPAAAAYVAPASQSIAKAVWSPPAFCCGSDISACFRRRRPRAAGARHRHEGAGPQHLSLLEQGPRPAHRDNDIGRPASTGIDWSDVFSPERVGRRGGGGPPCSDAKVPSGCSARHPCAGRAPSPQRRPAVARQCCLRCAALAAERQSRVGARQKQETTKTASLRDITSAEPELPKALVLRWTLRRDETILLHDDVSLCLFCRRGIYHWSVSHVANYKTVFALTGNRTQLLD